MGVTWEVIDFLMGLHAGKEIGLDVIVGPAEVEVQIGEGVGLQEPFILLGDVLDHRVLRVCMGDAVPLTLMTSLFFFDAQWAL